MAVKEVAKDAEKKMKDAVGYTKREFSSVRTGRASPALVEHIMVDYYGTPTQLKQLAAINTPDAKLIVIQPWDPSSIEAVEKAILQSNLGITPNNDGKLIRLGIPALTDERRAELDKVIKKMAENGKISLRSIRHEANAKVEKLEKDKTISKDECFWGKDDIQKAIDKYTKELEEALKEKEKELVAV
ncbi:MAG: ribosome recycling factor [Candidatus Omnitrophica bacterium]|nr:ribosome recycling factor [Candidatus Omnitrophota bacterium]